MFIPATLKGGGRKISCHKDGMGYRMEVVLYKLVLINVLADNFEQSISKGIHGVALG